MSLEEVARATKIGQGFLEALEADDFGRLPAGPFAKGFIRAYCQALKEPPDQVLALYSETIEVAARDRRAPTPLPHESLRRTRAPLLISLALLVVLALALAAVTLVLKPRRDGGVQRPSDSGGGGGRVVPRVADVQGVVAPATAGQSLAPIRTAAPAVARPAAPTPIGYPPAAPVASRNSLPAPRPATAVMGKPYRLVARASHATWIRVRLDGRTVEETIPAGAVREWVSNRPFELRIANAGGVTLELNGRVLPPLGPRGSMVHRLVLPAQSR